ncbi:MAG: hypothetical protein WC651_01585 [Candidatus Gracilibacteria bacterium]|jgi:hypothetical protein
MTIEPVYIGSLGAGLILLAFVLGQIHVWKVSYFSYDLMNALGSIFLVYYGYVGSAWPFVVLNTVWAIVSLKDCVTDIMKNARKPASLGPWEKWMK